MVNRCEHCLFGQKDDGSRSDCYGRVCEYFAPLNPETEDEMIYNMVEKERREYYNAYIDYIDADFYFD